MSTATWRHRITMESTKTTTDAHSLSELEVASITSRLLSMKSQHAQVCKKKEKGKVLQRVVFGDPDEVMESLVLIPVARSTRHI